MRRCRECGVEKEETDFYLTKYGYPDTICKTCVKARRREMRRHHGAKVREDKVGSKPCGVCREVKPYTEFHKNKGNPDGYNSNCKPCAIAIVTASFQKHPETRRRLQRAHNKSVANQLRNHRKLLRRFLAPGDGVTEAQWIMICELYHHRCVYCGKKPKKLTVDHIIPLSKGGEHSVRNVIPACHACNSRKGDRDILCPIQPLLLMPVGA